MYDSSWEIVSEGSASSSVLFYKIWGEHDLIGIGGSRMPPSGGILSPTETAAIMNWINAGAPE